MGRGLVARRACCMLETWGCSVALSWGSRENVDHSFDSLDICIITFVYQWEIRNKAWPLTDVLEVPALHVLNKMWARSSPGENEGMNNERLFLSLKRFSLNVEAVSCAGNALTETNGAWHAAQWCFLVCELIWITSSHIWRSVSECSQPSPCNTFC